MSTFICCNSEPPTTAYKLQPQPLKFRLVKSLHALDLLLSHTFLPGKKQNYTFRRQSLVFLQYGSVSHIPLVYLKSDNPFNTIILVYCHGRGSTLNNVYNYGNRMRKQFGISVLLFDYTGEGESCREFVSFQADMKVVLAWVLGQGYELGRVILCGYSLGSFAALAIAGPMPRVLISPFMGLIPLVEQNCLRYEGQMFDNVANAQKIKASTLMLHGKNEIIPIGHSEAIYAALTVRNKDNSINFCRVSGLDHAAMPNYLLMKQSQKYFQSFLYGILDQEHSQRTVDKRQAQRLQLQLKGMYAQIQQHS